MGSSPALAVLGSPIAHSRSPLLHAAAYRRLGLDWSYQAIEMTGERLPAFLDSRGPEWRGLSLTMPVKHDVVPLLDEQHDTVRLTGVCNTLLFDDGVRRGFNTDIHGIVMAFKEAGVSSMSSVEVIGGGATASSAIVAAAQMGAVRVRVSVRNPQKSRHLLDLAPRLGIDMSLESLGSPLESAPDAVISTIPNGADAGLAVARELRRASVLFDVAYEPWPTSLAQSWLEAGGRVISGFEMLLHQAVMQVRVFTSGEPDTVLPDEDAVIADMRAAVGMGAGAAS
ncbi:shikimate dehydrogenase [Homoserinimonas hongtaonis]|uniref:shikimate dehydrogenase n=1 Tax=Homoserinimonas hongtaonis TaxID=2079791 RepID=UPI000D360C7C|nr:shikimate dehydrogenase [Salinibacterium hongtaonis]